MTDRVMPEAGSPLTPAPIREGLKSLIAVTDSRSVTHRRLSAAIDLIDSQAAALVQAQQEIDWLKGYIHERDALRAQLRQACEANAALTAERDALKKEIERLHAALALEIAARDYEF